MHGWNYEYAKLTTEKGNFLHRPNFPYSNNPHLRRNKALYDAKILPMKEFYDEENNPIEKKGHKLWGQSEIIAGKLEKAWFYKWGNFIHEADPVIKIPQNTGCGKYGPYGISTCKYGFTEWRQRDENRSQYCNVCDGSKDYKDLSAHDIRFITAYENKKQLEKLRSGITPCVDVDFIP